MPEHNSKWSVMSGNFRNKICSNVQDEGLAAICEGCPNIRYLSTYLNYLVLHNLLLLIWLFRHSNVVCGQTKLLKLYNINLAFDHDSTLNVI